MARRTSPKRPPRSAVALRKHAFVLALLADPKRVVTAAALAAGYSAKSAHSQGSRLMQDPWVQDQLARYETATTQQATERAVVDKQRVIEELERIALSDIGEVLDFSGEELKLRAPKDIPEHARRALAKVKVKRFREGRGFGAKEVEVTEFALWPKLEALVALGKTLGIKFPEAHEHSGPDGAPIATTDVELTADERRARLAQLLPDLLAAQREGATP